MSAALAYEIGAGPWKGMTPEQIAALTPEQLQEMDAENVARWYDDPVLFVREAFGLEVDTKASWGVVPADAPDAGEPWDPIDEFQKDTLDAVAHHNRVAMKASKGPGKTTVLVWILWWYLRTRLHPRIVCTSITRENLFANLWTEAAKWYGRSLMLQALFEITGNVIRSRQHPATWWAQARAWPKEADKERQADSLAGLHEDYVLVLLDEVGGYPQAIVDTAEAVLANAGKPALHGGVTEAKVVMAGNPTDLEGPLWNAFRGNARKLWHPIEINGDPENPKRARRVSETWARELIDKYGRDHPIVRINVLGEFPLTQSNKLLGPEQVENAQRRVVPRAAYTDYPRILGVDVGRSEGRNRTVIQPRQGPVAFPARILRVNDTMTVVDVVVQVIKSFKPHACFIDVIGVGGGVYDRLRELGYDVVGINSALPASNKRYLNRRAQMWWEMAEWVKERGCLPSKAEQLKTDLCAPTWWITPAGKIQVEGKDELEDRGFESPDEGDGLALTFAQDVPFPEVFDVDLSVLRERFAQAERRAS